MKQTIFCQKKCLTMYFIKNLPQFTMFLFVIIAYLLKRISEKRTETAQIKFLTSFFDIKNKIFYLLKAIN